ncbi:hypothetical protein [Paenibacillus montanisoli]|uniref:Uncharacterized protein n=1 Tax=Paenibacillus montanisoli TaxID=2081970 RepID=A0A328U2V2_9BACL|nr:hypothetical protein [Paenibacillus montanisoli]RAP77020.1 hypothetical protein DL346_00495 [Paenibacillus montanisoli]
MNHNRQPQAGRLANWLLSWVQPNGAILGFHNRSAGGADSYRWTDFTSDHSTWASPLLPSIALLLLQRQDAKLERMLLQLVRFQTSAFQEDGQYAHIGFQFGENETFSLIYNAMANISLGLTLEYGDRFLQDEEKAAIREAMEKNFKAIDRIYPFGTKTISNQEYARVWAKLLYVRAFGGDDAMLEELRGQLDNMASHYLFSGLPDPDCLASYRCDQDKSSTEAGESYGLLIGPLLLAYRLFGDENYLKQAGALCRHVARSSWQDRNGRQRMHRIWNRSGRKWTKIVEPRLIAGMGLTLFSIQEYIKLKPDSELLAYLDDCDRTFAYYQNPRGYFGSPIGCYSEAGIAPSTAWHSHVLLYFAAKPTGLHDRFWQELHDECLGESVSVLLGNSCIWMECGQHWTITDYFGWDPYQLVGRKDEGRSRRDMSCVGGERAQPGQFGFKNRPIFMKTNEGIYCMPGHAEESELQLSSIADVPYRGLWN